MSKTDHVTLFAFLRGDYFWRHERRWEYRLALVICRVFGHACSRWTDDEDGSLCRGDCRRCWG